MNDHAIKRDIELSVLESVKSGDMVAYYLFAFALERVEGT